ncbi:RF-1 peptide chain release factor [Mycobacterium phage ArcherS7]|uniref:RF-1 peptide chain release factor n=13 Tax=Bixzunavirus TaxID=680114 RepID=A0A0N9ETN9_9CAUD|nr:RF-1 domain peptide chain release factor [Mycobacterium phage ArcherS7]YP_009012963.1 RF-1 domain peptide chain release factor [Mycobacterium phage Dandelion]YP_010057820.1 RF-1 domain peptide chain release factor [Mycobacterium phage Mangeria]YP_010058504.1 RF-1 domain peptide chain release factor [Mycobacterium phage Quasimodo]AEJ94939.1 RF-1 peptide chain release factor [Mycobacterium phage Ghost]AER25543.1 RF-1 peptide chain release factor [Mycobacterium phage Wally]AER49698.1 RF-1 pep
MSDRSDALKSGGRERSSRGTREKVLSVTLADCVVETKRGHGNGGQNRNTRDTAVRIVHPPSGAVGESQEERSQLQNKKTAFRRMAESSKFQLWLKRQVANDDLIKAQVEREMWPVNLKTEVREDGKWVEKTDRELT